MTNKQFHGRTAVITGGASGIGLAVGTRFQRLGAQVILIDRNWHGSQANGKLIKLDADVGDPRDIDRLFNGGKESIQVLTASRVDILVNAAGENLACDIVNVTPEQWSRVLATNLGSAFMMCKRVIPLMAERGGSIINVSSTASLLPRTNDPVYGISKAALNDLTRRFALRYAEDRIRVNAVCPGAVSNTNIQRENMRNASDPKELERQLIDAMPLGKAFSRMVTPKELARLVVYLASDWAHMITGAVIPVDGGKSLGIPRHLNTNNVA